MRKETLLPVFRVTNAEESAKWYEKLGFKVDGIWRHEPHFPAYMFLSRGDILLHLSEYDGDAQPNALAYFFVEDLEHISNTFDIAIKNQPWGKEIELKDPDNNRIRVGLV